MTDTPFVLADGLFFFEAGDAARARGFVNRPIDTDSRRSQTNPETAKFSFEFKRGNF